MYHDTNPALHYYPTGMAYGKATLDDAWIGNELAYDGITDGQWWHGLVVKVEYVLYKDPNGVEHADVMVSLENDEDGDEHTVALRYLEVPLWGRRA